ncbi:hypothetical protein AtEden1_Chr2g0269291 [Arabidopsis thaliana]
MFSVNENLSKAIKREISGRFKRLAASPIFDMDYFGIQELRSCALMRRNGRAFSHVRLVTVLSLTPFDPL